MGIFTTKYDQQRYNVPKFAMPSKISQGCVSSLPAFLPNKYLITLTKQYTFSNKIYYNLCPSLFSYTHFDEKEISKTFFLKGQFLTSLQCCISMTDSES